MKNITILITTYNSSKYITKLLQSINHSKNLVTKVIIMENNSPDEQITKNLISEFKQTHDLNIMFISNKSNVGFAKSCNRIAKTSKSKYILFLNPDTELKRNSLRILLTHAIQLNADIAGGKAIDYSGRNHGSVVRCPNLFIGLFEFTNLGKLFRFSKAHEMFYCEDIDVLNSEKDTRVDVVSGAYLLAKRKAFEKLGGFDEEFFMYLEDVDLGKRANDAGMNVIFCPHSVIQHVGGASSKNKYKIRHQAWFDSRKYYFKKHFGFLTNLIIQPIFEIEEFLLKLIKSL